MDASSLDAVGHALSIVAQQRYVWLLCHITRAVTLQAIDATPNLNGFPVLYHFSEEEQRKGAAPVPVRQYLSLLCLGRPAFAESVSSGEKYDGPWTRELTLVGLRRGHIMAVQSYLEHHRIESVFRGTMDEELFVFVRQARNILAHAPDARMTSRRLVRARWRHRVIDQGEETLQLSDVEMDQVTQDIITLLARSCVDGGRQIGFTTLNLAIDVPFIQQYVRDRGIA